jgi:hypothetical protein
MLILAAEPAAWANNEPTADDGVIDDWGLYTRALHDAGVLVGGHGLEGTDTATTIRVRAGKRSLTDGPFVDSKEHLIGYYIVDAPDLDTVIQWAAKAPNARIGSVEIRPLMPDASPDVVLADN